MNRSESMHLGREFFECSDHLGCTSYITDRDGNATQFVCYKPYGESLIDEHNTTFEQPWKFNGKELDSETGLYYYGARYYEPTLALWHGVDALAEKYPSMGGYVYCAGNPVRLVDPDGNDWYMANNEDVSTPVYFEGHDEHDGYTNIGSSVCAISTDGNQRNFNTDGTITTQTPLSEVLVKVPRKDDINRYASTSTFASSGPDAAGIQFSIDFCIVMGAGIDVRIGQTRSGEHYLSLDVNAELGLDVGISAGTFISNYSHGDNTKPNYSHNSMKGEGFGAGVGMGLSYNYSRSKVTPNQIQNEDYHKWTTHSIQMCGGELGGNVTIGKTFVPLTW